MLVTADYDLVGRYYGKAGRSLRHHTAWTCLGPSANWYCFLEALDHGHCPLFLILPQVTGIK